MDDEAETYRLWRVRKTVMQVCLAPDSVLVYVSVKCEVRVCEAVTLVNASAYRPYWQPYVEDISKRDLVNQRSIVRIRTLLCGVRIGNSFHVIDGTYNKITFGIYFVAYTTREFYYGFMEVLLCVLLEYIHSCNRARRGSRITTTTTVRVRY